MLYNYPRVVIAGLRGGSGKTTLSIAVARLFKNRGLKVTCFKKGPDYIDPGWLAKASGTDCYNLDPFMIPSSKLIASFVHHSKGSDIVVIEGNRGLYDGVDIEGSWSTAELAKLIKAPVVLVVDCTKVTRTVAALIKGLQEFDRGVAIKGVVLNNISGRRHESVVRGAIERYTDCKVLGIIRRSVQAPILQRHLGLTPYQEHPDVEETIDYIAGFVEETINMDEMMEIAYSAAPIHLEELPPLFELNEELRRKSKGLRIGVIRDEAFQFYYPENLEIMREYEMEIVFIDAMRQESLPTLDLLYIGGGFPETNALELSGNRAFMTALRREVEKGLPVYAECGGLMYLGRQIEYAEGVYPMTGVLPLDFRMETTPVAHGYTVVEVVEDSTYYRKGTILKGHEFHYSRVVSYDRDMRFCFQMRKGRGIKDGFDGLLMGKVFATYTHLHTLSAPEWIEGLINTALC